MVFSSTIFLVGYLPFVLAAYFLSPRRFRNVCLIFASLFFYAWGEREFAWVLPLSIVGNYVAGVWIARARMPMRVLAAAVAVNLLLLFSISWLVGLNASFAAFALSFRTKNIGSSWIGGAGAFLGLFSSCPTCAGLAIIALFGGTGTLSAAFFLGPLQALFVGLSIPILIGAPIMSARSLRNLEGQGCPRP